jgi:hypothetical protein
LELLARAAVAKVSPVLLAERDKDFQNVLYALERSTQEPGKERSIKTNEVFDLCAKLFGKDFTQDDKQQAIALTNQRNAELHTGIAAFENYTQQDWLPGFYKACAALSLSMGLSLEDVLNETEAGIAAEAMEAKKKEVISRVKKLIASHAEVFLAKQGTDKGDLIKKNQLEIDRLTYQRHHKVNCPSCTNPASVQGDTFGPVTVENNDDGEIVLKQAVMPRAFQCRVCDLKLNNYAELSAAGLGNQYTRTTTQTPAEYYGLLDPDSDDLSQYIEDHLDSMGQEYDNE